MDTLVRVSCASLFLLGMACGPGGETAPVPAAEPAPSQTDDQSRDLLRALSGDQLDLARAAVKRIVSVGDRRFVAVLIELMRASHLQILHADGRAAYPRALEALTGEMFGDDWAAWVAWYAGTDLEPPPGFTGWKGELLGRLDPAFAELLPPRAPAAIRVEEIIWGGAAFGGIPSLDQPKTITADAADYLEPGEPVFGVALGGEARAYPLRILDWHEMVNDVVGGVPFALAYCTLCGSGIAFDARATNGEVYEFGSSGLLMRSNKLMVDRQTKSLWNHLTGRPVVGPLVGGDVRLRKLPLVVTTWRDWKAAHPETLVLDIETGHQRPYVQGASYGGYFATPELMFPVSRRDERSRLLDQKARVFAVEIEGVPVAYPVDLLSAERVVNDRVANTDLVIVATRGVITVEGRSVRGGPATYQAGAEVRAYERPATSFSAGPDASILLDAENRPWRITEEALLGPDGQRAPRIPGFLSYWFGWYAFNPETLVYGVP